MITNRENAPALTVSGMELRELITDRKVPEALTVPADASDSLALAKERTALLYASVEARSMRPPLKIGGVVLHNTSEINLAGAGMLANIRAEQAGLPQPEV
ncbi:MAG TPA: hypothetical protein VJR27_02435 [Candidatus Saccharimonadales bacterium]|nr:hypothetical protein [Candidatus Saccharimonadales bacterium]